MHSSGKPFQPGLGGGIANPIRKRDAPTHTRADGHERSLISLLTLFSPAFPIGGFAWSHGLEAAVAEDRLVVDRHDEPSVARAGTGEAVAAWIDTLLDRGSGWNDGVLLVEGFRAAEAGDLSRSDAVAQLAQALAGSAERRAETLALGTAFAEAAAPWADSCSDCAQPPLSYPVAVGRVAAQARLPLRETLTAFGHGFAASLVSAAVRLVPLAQSDAVAVLHHLEPAIARFAERALGSTLDDLGSAALGSDIAAMRHETLSTRLFRS